MVLNKWIEHKGEPDVSAVTTQDIRAYLAWLRTAYQPKRYNGQTHPLSPKTIRNWAILSSFFKWACQEFAIPNPMQGIPAPRFKKSPVEAFTKDEVKRLLKYARSPDIMKREPMTSIHPQGAHVVR